MSNQTNFDFPVEGTDFIDMREIFPGIFAFRWMLNNRRHTKFFTDVFPKELIYKLDAFSAGGCTEVSFEDVRGILGKPNEEPES